MARLSTDTHSLFINPPSPALTNPDLILPFESAFELSPRKEPPSPPEDDVSLGGWNHGTQLNYSMPMRSSPAIGYGTPLSIIDELETTPSIYSSNHGSGSDAVRSTSTPKNAPSVRLDPGWDSKHQRRWSNGSGSVHSDDIENMHWPDFEGPSEVDDESVVLDDEEEQLGDLPKIADDEDCAGELPYISPHVDSMEDDPLSRRADMILANAKKRLHAMETGLRGARNSLMLSAPSSPNSSHYSHVDKERPRFPTSTGVYSHKTLSIAPQISTQHMQNFGHNRMLSDSSSARGIQPPRNVALPTRSSSALGSFGRSLSSLENSASLRGVRSQQDMRESRLQSWIEESSIPSEAPRPVTAEPTHSRSPSRESMMRPGSAASSLRYQMEDLKGRINSLKAKAHEERSRRLSSMSSGRTASPLVLADAWYDSESVKSYSTVTDVPMLRKKKSSSTSDEDSRSSRSRKAHDRTTTPRHEESAYEDSEEALHKIREESEDSDEPSTPSTSVLEEEQKVLMGPQEPSEDELGYNVDEILNGQHNRRFDDEDIQEREISPDAASMDGYSEYFDSVPVMAERHEDRADAFDYENFFLHSAMGSYTRERRDSVSSESSVETTRPLSPKGGVESATEAASPPRKVRTGYGTLVEDSPGLHRRSHSVESISTVATFQTATEGNGSNGSDDEEDLLDAVTQQILPPTVRPPVLPSPMQNFDSAVHLAPSPMSPKGLHLLEQHELTSAFVSSLLGTGSTGSKDVSASDIELVQDVVSRLQSVVTNLRAQPREYDRREWRRRLDAARNALDQL